MGMGMANMGNQMGFDAANAYKQEREIIGLIKHHHFGENAEKLLLGFFNFIFERIKIIIIKVIIIQILLLMNLKLIYQGIICIIIIIIILF